MVILEKTKTQLKLRHRPYSLWIITGSWMLGILLIILVIYLQYTWLIYLWWMPLFLVGNMVTCSLVLLFAGQVVTYNFDKDSNSLTINRRSLLNTQVIWHSLADILNVQVKSTSWHEDENANYQTVILLKSGEILHLTLGQDSNIKKKLEAINMIREFLGMPPQKVR